MDPKDKSQATSIVDALMGRVNLIVFRDEGRSPMKVKRITSINRTLGTVRVIPRGGTAVILPIDDIGDVR